jgi:hypothetical protein
MTDPRGNGCCRLILGLDGLTETCAGWHLAAAGARRCWNVLGEIPIKWGKSHKMTASRKLTWRWDHILSPPRVGKIGGINDRM